MKTFEIKSYGKTYKVHPVLNRYMNDTLAISLVAESGEPFCTLTVNLATSVIWCNEKTAFVDINNCPWAEQFIADNELGSPVGYTERSGFCIYPLYVFNLKKFLD